MLQITPQHRLFFSIDPIDFRCGIDSLIGLCRKKLAQDPFTGMIFVFTNKRQIGVKLLVFDGSGFWLCHKRFSQKKLQWWPKTTEQAASLRAVELMVMLQQGHPKVANVPEDWRRLPQPFA